MYKIIEGGVTAAKGFQATGVHAGLKKKKKDMALVYSEVPAVASGTYTKNLVKAAPVVWDKKLTDSGRMIQAMIVNSGVANACTGKAGDMNNEQMAKLIADELSIDKMSVLTASTGVIGKQLPMEPISAGVKLLKENLGNTLMDGQLAAEAIMTTDTISKEVAVTIEAEGKTVTIGAMCKGSGMIHPDMATMIGIVTTDACITKELLKEALSNVVKESFNMISVDRDTSTNDTYVILANGLAGNKLISEKGKVYDEFCEALMYVSKTLAKMMAGDGEGATKLLEVTVKNAETKEQAKVLAKSVISSNLVKAMIFGNDANWGRILCAMGYAGVSFNPTTVDVSISDGKQTVKLAENSLDAVFSEETATEIISAKEVNCTLDIKLGTEEATAWGCDLTYDYVKINGDYRS